MAEPVPETVRAWTPRIAGVREVLHARFVRHAYPVHSHDAWTLFVVDEGAIAYELAGHHRHATRAMVSVLPPHLAHDGRPATPAGYRKRCVYVDRSILPERLLGAAVDQPWIVDPSLRVAVDALHNAFDSPDGPLEAETRLHIVAERIVRRLERGSEPSAPAPRRAEIAEAVRAAFDEDLFGSPSIASVASALGVGASTAARAFRAVFGLPPHAYVLGRRLEAARARVLAGQPLADVAVETGFVDQAHLTNRFRRLAGVTPGRFARSVP
ncbi:MAG TPA: AraC family transcriptional regulator [Candidatus Dormibacteraeota bacterium]|nr:AraC family transcriptional regulator [Candidatus Dormibacteraeota bacterium]